MLRWTCHAVEQSCCLLQQLQVLAESLGEREGGEGLGAAGGPVVVGVLVPGPRVVDRVQVLSRLVL